MREKGEDKQAIDVCYESEHLENEGPLDFCLRMGWSDYIWQMLVAGRCEQDDYFKRAQIQAGGYGVQWDENLIISDSTLYRMGKRVPLTAEAAEILNCSRQYISELVKKISFIRLSLQKKIRFSLKVKC